MGNACFQCFAEVPVSLLIWAPFIASERNPLRMLRPKRGTFIIKELGERMQLGPRYELEPGIQTALEISLHIYFKSLCRFFYFAIQVAEDRLFLPTAQVSAPRPLAPHSLIVLLLFVCLLSQF